MSSYLGDNPIFDKRQDVFQRSKFAEQIASISVSNSPRSLVISIHGKWGEGKSSLVNMVSNALPEEVIKLKFNPWLFKNESQLLRAFFRELASSLGEKLETKKEKLGEMLEQYGDAVGALENVPKLTLWVQAYKFVASYFKPKSPTIEELKKRIDNHIVNSGKNIVIFIDDIDRLDAEEVEITFKLVKLLGDFSRTSYILSFDLDLVANMISPRYGGTLDAGYKFLEKIIQVPLSLPKAPKSSIHKYVITSIENIIDSSILSETQFERKLTDLVSPLISTPREAIRYSNALRFSLPLLQGEVNITDLVLLECLRTTVPELYQFIRDNKDFFLTDYHDNNVNKHEDIKTPASKIMQTFLTNHSENKKNIIREITCTLFPRFVWVDEREIKSGKPEKWLIRRRLCSYKYFDRYFGYALMPEEISDIRFNDIYLKANKHTIEDLSKSIKNDFEVYTVDEVIFKLVYYRDIINEKSAEQLAIALATVSIDLPNKSGLSIGSTFSLAAMTVQQLIANLDPNMSLSTAIKVITEASSLNFASEMVGRFVMPESENKKPLFIDSASVDIKRVFVDRIKTLLANTHLLNVLDEDLMLRLFIWWLDIDKEEIKKKIGKSLENKNNALKILRIFTPTVYSTSLGNESVSKFKANFGSKEYLRLADFVDLKFLNQQLTEIYGDQTILYKEVPLQKEPIDDIGLVRLFQYIFATKTLNVTSFQYLSWENTLWEAKIEGAEIFNFNDIKTLNAPLFVHQGAGNNTNHKSHNIHYCSEIGEDCNAVIVAHLETKEVRFTFLTNKRNSSTTTQSDSIRLLGWDRNVQEISLKPMPIVDDSIASSLTIIVKQL